MAPLVTLPVMIPGLGNGARATELVNFAALAALLASLVLRLSLHRAVGALLIAVALSTFWIFDEISALSLHLGSVQSRMILVRWLMSVPTAYWLIVLMQNRRWRTLVTVGLLIGLLICLATVIWDYTLFDPMAHVPDAFAEEQVAYLGDIRRATGIFSHPNAAAATVLLAVPLLLGLVDEGRVPRGLLAVAAVMIGCIFFTTESRAESGIAIALMGWYFVRRSFFHALATIVAIGLVFAVAATVKVDDPAAQQGLFGRATDFASGMGDRELTTRASFDIALENPLGVGSRYESMLQQRTGIDATHDGWAQLAMLAGWPLMLLVLIQCCRHAARLWSRPRPIEAWVAAYILAALLFENQFFVPTFSAFCLWLVYLPAKRLT